jgi:hypothetical protein
MSARAASRLASLGFMNVYRYQAGKADWFAAGLPREGKEAHVPRVADVALRDVATCRLDERVGDVRDRMRADQWSLRLSSVRSASYWASSTLRCRASILRL